MCKIMEDMRNESLIEGMKEGICHIFYFSRRVNTRAGKNLQHQI